MVVSSCFSLKRCSFWKMNPIVPSWQNARLLSKPTAARDFHCTTPISGHTNEENHARPCFLDKLWRRQSLLGTSREGKDGLLLLGTNRRLDRSESPKCLRQWCFHRIYKWEKYGEMLSFTSIFVAWTKSVDRSLNLRMRSSHHSRPSSMLPNKFTANPARRTCASRSGERPIAKWEDSRQEPTYRVDDIAWLQS